MWDRCSDSESFFYAAPLLPQITLSFHAMILKGMGERFRKGVSSMYKSCSRCGRMHPTSYVCTVNRVKREYVETEERKLRSTNKWTEKSKEIRDKANYLCEVCRANGVFTYNNLEVHHITKLSQDSGGLLDNENLICLCQEHHKEADRGTLSANLLREIAKRREDS